MSAMMEEELKVKEKLKAEAEVKDVLSEEKQKQPPTAPTGNTIVAEEKPPAPNKVIQNSAILR